MEDTVGMCNFHRPIASLTTWKHEFSFSVIKPDGISIRYNAEFGLVSGTDLAFFAERTRRRTFEELAEYSNATRILTTMRTTLFENFWTNHTQTKTEKVLSLNRVNLVEFPLAHHTAKQWGIGDIADIIRQDLNIVLLTPRRLRYWVCSYSLLIGT
jgi:hypothetical protein